MGFSRNILVLFIVLFGTFTLIEITSAARRYKRTLGLDEDPVPEEPKGKCDIKNCSRSGYCKKFERCGPDGNFQSLDCPKDKSEDKISLFWNPKKNDIHGGVCDLWDMLGPDLQAAYMADVKCVPPCAYKPEKPCGAIYFYYDGKPNVKKYKFECKGGLLFNPDPKVLTCDFCINVKNHKDQTPCKC